MNFAEHLGGYTTTELQRVFRGLGRKCPTRKVEMVDALTRIWLNEPGEILKRMGEAERLMLAMAVHEGHEAVSVERLTARYGLTFKFGYDIGGRGNEPIRFIRLFVHHDYGEYLILNDVLDALVKLLPAPSPLKVKVSAPDLDGLELFETEAAVFPELKRMLQLVATGKLKVSETTGLPSTAAMKTVGTALHTPEDDRGPIRSYVWPVLLQQCGWAGFRAGTFGLKPTGRALLEQFEPKLFAEGVRTLMFDAKFDEIFRVSDIKGFRGGSARRCWCPVEGRRSAVFDALKALPEGEWVSMDDAYGFLVASGGDCRVVAEGESLYICDREYGELYDQEWNIGKVYFRQLVCESLATLGLVDLLHREEKGYPSDLDDNWGMDGADQLTCYDGIRYIRLTPLGRFCLGDGGEAYEPPAAEHKPLFNVLPNHEIVVVDPAGFSVGDSAQLERFARKVSDVVWKMDRKTVFGALENGVGEVDILSVLQAGSANEIPATVLHLLRETVERAGRIRDRMDAVAVEFVDEHTALLVQSENSIAPTLLGRNGATLFVRAKNLGKFQGGLRKMGILLP